MTEARDPHGLAQMFYNKHSKKRGDVWSSLTDRTDAGDYRIVNRWFVVRGMDN